MIFRSICVFFFIAIETFSVYGQDTVVPKISVDTGHKKVDSLKAVIVTANARPHIKGDTLQYNVDRILLQPNAVVEELLRRLPGLHVDPDGTITYNGEKIQHLLVDGEDIFGSDPTMVTRNFDASKIARVQILDRKSDQAVFTGVDDGVRTKTLNLVLKSDAKDGYFGRIDAGANADGYYNVNPAAAGFKENEQFTALGIAANTGVLGSSNSPGTAQISFLNANTDPLGASAGAGIPRFDAVALHYANKWGMPGSHLSSNYQYSDYHTEPIGNSEIVQILPDSVYQQIQASHSTNQQIQHWGYGTYELALNSVSAFRLTFHGSNSQERNQFVSSGNSTFNDTLVNSSQRSIYDNVSKQSVGGDVSWRTQVGKNANRVFSLSGGTTMIDLMTNGYLYSESQFYQPGGRIENADTADQRMVISSHSRNVEGSFGFTEPLWNGAILGMSYNLSLVRDNPFQGTYNKGDGKYEEAVDSLSSRLKTENINQRGRLNLQGRLGKLEYVTVAEVFSYTYRQTDLVADAGVRIQYTRIAPSAIFTFNANQSTAYEFNYNMSLTPPDITQLMPIRNNSDPLHMTLGNPDLRPTTNQNFRLDFHRFKSCNIDITLNLGFADNAISTKTTTDSLGRQISIPMNVKGDRNAGINFSINKKISGFDVDAHMVGGYARTADYINSILNNNDGFSGGGGIGVARFVANKYLLDLHTDFTSFNVVSSVNTSAPVRYWSQNHMGSVTLYLIRNYEVNTNVTYTWQQKTASFPGNPAVLRWSGYITRNLMQDKVAIRFQFNNILNVNAGITRTNTGNVNTQTSNNILGRYWMISATYHFDKKFKKK